MRILVCGANGFIGKAIAERLVQVGHCVVKGVRRPDGLGEIAVDYTRDLTPEVWLPRLAGVYAVVNAVGVLVESDGQTFSALHDRAPRALFAACRESGVQRVIQISALGAHRGGTAYFTSKCAADEFLAAQPVGWQIVRPALVYGSGGSSARFFRALASLPVVGLPAGGRQLLQPIHIDDLTELVLRLLDPDTPTGQCVEAVGGRALEYREMLRCYRRTMGIPPALEIPIPRFLMRLAARAAGMIPGAMLNPDTWKMLEAGNVGDAGPISRILGRLPRASGEFIAREEAPALRQQAIAVWRGALLRASLAFVWIAAGLVSLFVYPRQESLAMLARVGLEGTSADAALYGAAMLDLGLGIATLLRPAPALWLAQMALIGVYTVPIALALPEYLIHPFGPVAKNVPLLAILVLLYAEAAAP